MTFLPHAMLQPWNIRRFLLAAIIGLAPAATATSDAKEATTDEIAESRKALHDRYAEKLAGLAGWCDERHLDDLAKRTRRWQPHRDPNQRIVYFPASSFAPPWSEAAATPDQMEWWRKFAELRKQQGAGLFDLANRASKAHRPQVAFELVTEAVRENPDHEQGRIVLGHHKIDNAWHTAFAAARTKGGDVWHEKFGWIPKGQVQKYEQGSRYVNNRWIKAEDDAKLHAEIANGWRIDTEHFAVLTNHSLEEGVKLSRRLERLYATWNLLFYTYHTSDAELAKLLVATTPLRPLRHQFQVMCFRDRTEYNRALGAIQPNIDRTLGAYFNSTKTVYFFAGDEQDEGTVNHEATHQLFQEVRAVAKDAAAKSNFWIVEGVACYLESMVEHEDYVTLGGFEEGRVPAARTRLFESQFYVPLAELTAMGMEPLQRDERLQKIYSQSAGLTQFLMHAEGGKFREPLMAYVESVYSNKADAATLSKLTNKTYEDLDREYREYLKSAK